MFLGQTVLVCQSYNGRYRSLSIRGKKNMHREIQIKQFPIVTTHWWPKTRNERFVWENEQYLYHFYLLYTTLSKWSECAHASGVWRVCARSGLCKRRKAPEVTRAFKGGSEHLGGMRARTQITWTWLCTRGKNDINTVRFLTQTARSCLRPSMCSYDGELFNLDFSVHVLFPSYRDSDLYLPLYDWQTRTVWPRNIKIGSTEEKKDTYILDALGVSW